MRIVALLMVRNEARYIGRCLEHLYKQGIETCIIDNGSEDGTLEIVERYKNRGVFRVDQVSYKGYFDLVEQLLYKEKLSSEIDCDWFIHCDADEIREAPKSHQSLHEAITKVNQLGFNSINFKEFVFLPTTDSVSFEFTDYVQTMRYYYYFEKKFHRVNAWKNSRKKIDLVSSGGHCVLFDDQYIYKEDFILRHYIALSRDHLLKKYLTERVYSPREISERGWHRLRSQFKATNLLLPDKNELKCIDDFFPDTTDPWHKHKFLG